MNESTRLVITSDPCGALKDVISELKPEGIAVITDDHVERVVLPLFADCPVIAGALRIVIPSGEAHKNLNTLADVWRQMTEGGLTRASLMVCIGGGCVSDIGGFAAATFKRGIRVVNIPTTLLAGVDAGAGGKTAIDFLGRKNEIGTYKMPEAVIICSKLFATLPKLELWSGYGEMLKTGLVADPGLYASLRDPAKVLDDQDRLTYLVGRCVELKMRIVDQDPHEMGLRRCLNFGHTTGHAYESLCLAKDKPLPHGICVAHGLLTSLILSSMLTGLGKEAVTDYAYLVRKWFPRMPLTCDDFPAVWRLMASDKKNRRHGHPLFTLLQAVGRPLWDREVSEADVHQAYDITLDYIGQ